MTTYSRGRHRPHPDSVTSTVCSWMLCTTRVTYRFQRAGIFLCQEHALQTWATVEEMNRAGQVKAEPPAASEPKPGYEGSVYYLRIGDRVKIGHTTNLFNRLASYPPNTEILLIRRGTRELERREHIRFSEHRTDGREWFHANERVLQMISEITDSVDNEWEPEWFQRRTHKPQTVTHRKLKSGRAGHGH